MVVCVMSKQGEKQQYVWTEQDQKWVQKFFNMLDTDGDGYVSKEEAAKLPAPGPTAFFRDCDANADGNVTMDELCAFLKKHASAQKPMIPVYIMFQMLVNVIEGKMSKDKIKSAFDAELKAWRAKKKVESKNSK
uniref:EF-hand domain-containing protein n=1 Tax=Lotharella oceanica TaxID=641309 RepID=A0A7S2TG36_9EUKA